MEKKDLANNFREIIFYKTADGNVKVEILLKDENLWLTQAKMAELFEVAAKIKPLYESAILVTAHGNLKNPNDPNVVSIKRFVSAAILKSGKKADVLITVKESIANGHRIYSIELDEINKASERFRGLSDAAENSGQGN